MNKSTHTPWSPDGYYETRCKWCGGSQHKPGEYCVALDHEQPTKQARKALAKTPL